ncbi:MAG: hypothetical protein CMJ87_09590 [Planctomycetes bacterium]|nr:hypothetical protein [Planctomycetota bacterium]
MKEHRHLSEEDLLEMVLRRTGEGAGISIAGCPSCAERHAQLTRFLDACRADLASAEQPEGANAASGEVLVERILASTTRRADQATQAAQLPRAAQVPQAVQLPQATQVPQAAHPGLAGDLRLIVDFTRRRLRHSRLLRVAAASLLLHLIALPILAWYAARPSAPPEPRIGFVLPTLPAEAWENPGEPAREVLIPEAWRKLDDESEARPVPVDPAAGQVRESQLASQPPAVGQLGQMLAAMDAHNFDPTSLKASPGAPLLERIVWGELLLNGLGATGNDAANGSKSQARSAWLALELPTSPDELQQLAPPVADCLTALWSRARGLEQLSPAAERALGTLGDRFPRLNGPGAMSGLLGPDGRRSRADQAHWRALLATARAASSGGD